MKRRAVPLLAWILLTIPIKLVTAQDRIIFPPEVKITTTEVPIKGTIVFVNNHIHGTSTRTRCGYDVVMSNVSDQVQIIETSGHRIELRPNDQIRWSSCFEKRDYYFTDTKTYHLIPLPVTLDTQENPWTITGSINGEPYRVEGLFIDTEIVSKKDIIIGSLLMWTYKIGFVLTVITILKVILLKIKGGSVRRFLLIASILFLISLGALLLVPFFPNPVLR